MVEGNNFLKTKLEIQNDVKLEIECRNGANVSWPWLTYCPVNFKAQALIVNSSGFLNT